MRTYDEEEIGELKAPAWMLEMVKCNPEYCSWGPHEDYMWDEGEGWQSRKIYASWQEFGPWVLNDLNECVNFYFEARRESKDCECCGGGGYHPKAMKVVKTFYPHQCAEVGEPQSAAWHDKITEEENDALKAEGRHNCGATAAETNAKNAPGGSIFSGHDGINRSILIRARLARMGLPVRCEECEGKGYIYTADEAHLSLVLWWLHPRKGCSRGIEVTRIEETEIPAVREFLGQATARNAERFSRILKF